MPGRHVRGQRPRAAARAMKDLPKMRQRRFCAASRGQNVSDCDGLGRAARREHGFLAGEYLAPVPCAKVLQSSA